MNKIDQTIWNAYGRFCNWLANKMFAFWGIVGFLGFPIWGYMTFGIFGLLVGFAIGFYWGISVFKALQEEID